ENGHERSPRAMRVQPYGEGGLAVRRDGGPRRRATRWRAGPQGCDRNRNRGDALDHRHGAVDQGRAPATREVSFGLSGPASHVDRNRGKWARQLGACGHSNMFAVQDHLLRPRRERRTAARFSAAALVLAVSLPSGVEAASCRGYPQAVRVAIKKHVEALRALEQETADRRKGFDTRPFSYLLARARATAASISNKDALAA